MEQINQFEACDRILRFIISEPKEWHNPLEIQTKFMGSAPIEKVKFLFDYMAMTQQPEPASFERDLNNDWWKIKMNGYTKEFLEEGGFKSRYDDMVTEYENEEEKNKLEKEKLSLETENLKYKQTIRDQEQRIRDLNEQNSTFQLIKNYWWLLLLLLSIGYFIGKITI